MIHTISAAYCTCRLIKEKPLWMCTNPLMKLVCEHLGQLPQDVLKTKASVWTSLAVHFCFKIKIKITCLHWIVSYRIQWRFQLLDRCSAACGARRGGSTLKHKGSWDGAGRRVGIQVLTRLFCHDQLVFCFSINHCFPLGHLQRRWSVVTVISQPLLS